MGLDLHEFECQVNQASNGYVYKRTEDNGSVTVSAEMRELVMLNGGALWVKKVGENQYTIPEEF